jgi:hypothetical protein
MDEKVGMEGRDGVEKGRDEANVCCGYAMKEEMQDVNQ